MTGESIFEIRVRGHLSDQWAQRFDGFTIGQIPGGDALLTGPVVDQAALHGVIKKVQALGMTLVSVIEIGREEDR